jgi:hypothetical protein
MSSRFLKNVDQAHLSLPDEMALARAVQFNCLFGSAQLGRHGRITHRA